VELPELSRKLEGLTKWYGWRGEELTLEQWVEVYAQGVHVGDTYIHKGSKTFRVSTVLLGRDQAFGAYSKPMIFETMTFAKGKLEDYFLNSRYFTLAEAKRGHKQAVKTIRRMPIQWHKPLIHKGRKP
jgi:hypothetical protein